MTHSGRRQHPSVSIPFDSTLEPVSEIDIRFARGLTGSTYDRRGRNIKRHDFGFVAELQLSVDLIDQDELRGEDDWLVWIEFKLICRTAI